jgi:hypothetical protein
MEIPPREDEDKPNLLSVLKGPRKSATPGEKPRSSLSCGVRRNDGVPSGRIRQFSIALRFRAFPGPAKIVRPFGTSWKNAPKTLTAVANQDEPIAPS